MNLIRNGNFAAGTESWVSIGDWPLTGEVQTIEGKDWDQMPGKGNVVEDGLRQITLLPQAALSDFFTLNITTKAIPTGASASGAVIAENETGRIIGRMNYWFTLHYGEASYTTGYDISVSVKPETYTRTFQLIHSRPVTHAELTFMVDHRPAYDRTDVLVTDISVIQEDLKRFRK